MSRHADVADGLASDVVDLNHSLLPCLQGLTDVGRNVGWAGSTLQACDESKFATRRGMVTRQTPVIRDL